VSGDLESLDFDHEEIIKPWAELVKLQGAEELLGALVLVKTPRGWHEYYRCTEGVEGNQKLAMRLGSDGKEKVLIETRGEGGYSLLPGCPPECHPLGKTYELVQGDLRAIPVITGEQRLLLLNAARALNEVVSPSAQFWGHPVRPGTAPVTNSMRGRDGRRSWSPPAGRECTSGTGSPFGSAPERPWAYRRP